MALWHVLILACFGSSVGAAILPPRIQHAGGLGYAAAAFVGLMVGTGSGWLMWLMHREFALWVRNRTDAGRAIAPQDWRFPAFYFSKLVWILFAMVLGFEASVAMQRLFH